MIVRKLIERRGRPALLLEPARTVREAADFLRRHEIGGAPVVESGRLIGFCSERDLVYQVVAEGRDPDTVSVRDVMTQKVVTASLDDTVATCEQRLDEAGCRHLPIVEDDKVVGCLSLRDFLRADLRECRLSVDELTSYIKGGEG